MAGIAGYFGKDARGDFAGALAELLNPSGRDTVEELRTIDGAMVVSTFPGWPGSLSRKFDDGRFTGVAGGDIISDTGEEVPWETITEVLSSGNPEKMPEFAGFFAVALKDRATGRLYLISDPYSFYPFFYTVSAGVAGFSTHIGAFPRMPLSVEIDPAWIYELLYYSFPVGPTGLWKDVQRAAPGTVIEIDVESGSEVRHRYGRKYREAPDLLKGSEAVDRAVDVFTSIMPKYYRIDGRIAHALTGGWDCRALSGLIPDFALDRVTSYTYGRPGSNDLVEARDIAAGLGLQHREILFDDSYVERIPALAKEAVFQAGGLENINRAYIPYVYDAMTDGASTHPAVISGIGADAMFRGHVPTPNGLSTDMDTAYRTGQRTVNDVFFREAFGPRFGDFREYIDGALDWFEKTYGGFDSVQSYFDYELYEGLPRYFNGECSIAGNYSALRIPYLDPEVMQLASDVEYSVLKLWRFINDDIYKETYIQSALIETNPRLARIPINGVPVRAFSCRNKGLYHLYRLAAKGPKKALSILRREEKKPLLEDWEGWYRTVLASTFDELLGEEARVLQYIEPAFIDRIRQDGDIHWMKLVTTAEIVLRLAENGWKRFWDDPLTG